MRYRIAVGTACLLAVVCTGFGIALAQEPPRAPTASATEAGDNTKSAGGITALSAWARATPAGAKVGAAFIELRAAPGMADRLLAASSPVAGAVELHDHVREGAVMKMRRVESIAIGAGQTVKLQPGGLHIMLMDLKGALVDGATMKLSLKFEKTGVIEVEALIAPLGAMSPHAGQAPPGATAPPKSPPSRESTPK